MALQSPISLLFTNAVPRALARVRHTTGNAWQQCKHIWLRIDAFEASGVQLLEKCHDSNSNRHLFLPWFVCEELHDWLDKAPARAATPLVQQLWGQLMAVEIRLTFSKEDVVVPETTYKHLAAYLSCICALPPEQLMAHQVCEEELDGKAMPIYEALVQVLGFFSKPQFDQYHASPLLQHFVLDHGWDPRALLGQLQRTEGFAPNGERRVRHQLLRNLLPLLLETDWQPLPADVFAGFWEAHQRTRWGMLRKYEHAPRDLILRRLYDVFPEHRLHAVLFVARSLDSLDATSMPLVFPLFEGRIQDQNHGRILEVSRQMLEILAKERAKSRTFFADCLRQYHCEWATVFDMHFLICGSPSCALQSQVGLPQAVAGAS